MATSSRAGKAMSLPLTEMARGERFEFGKNWSRFLDVLDEDRILKAFRQGEHGFFRVVRFRWVYRSVKRGCVNG